MRNSYQKLKTVWVYSLNQKVDDESVTLQSSSTVPLFSVFVFCFFFKNVCFNVIIKVIINVDFEAVFVLYREVRKWKFDANMVHCVKSMKVSYPVIPEHHLLEVWALRPRRTTQARFSCYWEQNACSERYEFFDFLSLLLINGSKQSPKSVDFSVCLVRPPWTQLGLYILKKLELFIDRGFWQCRQPKVRVFYTVHAS